MNTTATPQTDKLKFPIGPFTRRENIGKSEIEELISDIENAPSAYRKIVANLSTEDLKKTYRPGSWNVQQLINHVADMQLLHFLRMKKAITEQDYKEVTLVNMDGWAQTADGMSSPVADSIEMFEGITKRFVRLMRSLTGSQLEIEYYHPVRKYTLNQKNAIAMTAWHVRHHLEHLRIALGQTS
jgi:hypothetical protein